MIVTNLSNIPSTAQTFLGLDTETTDFKKNGPLIQEGQVRILQMAMILFNRQGKMLKQVSLVVKPEGEYKISEGAFKAHGLTLEHCQRYGVSMKGVYALYERMAGMADYIVAHNANFDSGILQVEEAYTQSPAVDKPWFCTMNSNKDVPGGKSLANVLKHYTGEDIGDKAHNAFYDTEACVKIFNAMLRKAA